MASAVWEQCSAPSSFQETALAAHDVACPLDPPGAPVLPAPLVEAPDADFDPDGLLEPQPTSVNVVIAHSARATERVTASGV
jgi:hypothetical protein